MLITIRMQLGFDPNTFFSSFSLVAVSEIGDKTQLLSFALASRFKRPFVVLLGILVATLLNHALASWVGVTFSAWLSPYALALTLSVLFFVFGVWALFPDRAEEVKPASGWGAFGTTLVLFFLAEMGDKTQLATAALAAQFQSVFWVTAGTTLGMLVTDGTAVVAGDRLADKVQSQWLRWGSACLFFLFAAFSAYQAFHYP